MPTATNRGNTPDKSEMKACDTQAPLSKDDPRIIAWNAYKATGDYKNTRNWALHDAHVDGSLWAAFIAGWSASSRPPADQVPVTSAQIQVAQDWIDNGFPVPNCAERVAIRAAIAALQAVPAASEVGWQPIESAPKDGTPCILFARAKNATDPAIIIGWYIDGEWIEGCYAPNHPVGLVPTHWMPNPPFPEPPALKASGEE